MRKIIALLLVLSVFSIQVYASSVTEVNRDNGAIAVFGNTAPDTQITLIILKDGKTKEALAEITADSFGDYVEYIDQTKSASNGDFIFNLGAQNPISFQRFAAFLNKVAPESEIEELQIVYYTMDSVDDLTRAVVSCESAQEVRELLTEDTEAILELDRLFYDELSDSERLEVLGAVAELTEGSAEAVRAVFFNSSVLCHINRLKTDGDVSALMTLAQKNGIAEEIFGFKTDKGSRYSSLKDYQKLFKTNIVKKTSFASVEEFSSWCNLQLALTCVKCFKSTALESVFEEFEEYLGIDLSLLNSRNEDDVYEALAGKSFDSQEEFAEAFEDAVDDADDNSGSGGSSGGGSGGGRSLGSSFGGAYSAAVDVVEKEQDIVEVQEEKISFPDVDKSHFAYNAIGKLAADKIISGYPDGSFCPDNRVTRGEFIKMVSEALLEKEGEVPVPEFTDVSDSSWYKPYVVLAVSNGIVKGISETEIGAELEITREEIFTIIYRICSVRGITLEDGAGAEFADGDSISDFAAEAVGRLAAGGIISGYGGMIRPKDTATRGECAKILYEIMQPAEG